MRKRIPDENGVGCFACKFIVEDFDLNGTLTGHPQDFNGHGIFPYQGKAEHIRLELATLEWTKEAK